MELQRTMLQSSRVKDEPLPAEILALVNNLREHFAKQRELRNALTASLSEPNSVRNQLCNLNAELDDVASVVSQTELRVSAQLKTADNFKHGELQTCARNVDFAKHLAEQHASVLSAVGAQSTVPGGQNAARVSMANLSDQNPLKRELDDALFGVYSDALAECERRLMVASGQLSTLEEQLTADWSDSARIRPSGEQFASNLVFAFGAFTACAAKVEQVHSALRLVREQLVGHMHAVYGDAIAQRLASMASLSDQSARECDVRVRHTSGRLGNAFANTFLTSDSAASRSVLADLARRREDAESIGVPLGRPSAFSGRRNDAESVPHVRIQLDGVQGTPARQDVRGTLLGPSPFGASPLNAHASATASLTPSGAPQPQLQLQPQPQQLRSLAPLAFTSASSTSTPVGSFAPAAQAAPAAVSASPFTLGAPPTRPVEQPQPGTKRAR